jgi:hypothetical protein
MLVRSTGLGRTELEGDIKTVDVRGDYIIIGMKTTEPVKWHVRVATNFSDLLTIAGLILFTGRGWKFIIVQLFKFVIRIFKRGKTYTRPDDY